MWFWEADPITWSSRMMLESLSQPLALCHRRSLPMVDQTSRLRREPLRFAHHGRYIKADMIKKSITQETSNCWTIRQLSMETWQHLKTTNIERVMISEFPRAWTPWRTADSRFRCQTIPSPSAAQIDHKHQLLASLETTSGKELVTSCRIDIRTWRHTKKWVSHAATTLKSDTPKPRLRPRSLSRPRTNGRAMPTQKICSNSKDSKM